MFQITDNKKASGPSEVQTSSLGNFLQKVEIESNSIAVEQRHRSLKLRGPYLRRIVVYSFNRRGFETLKKGTRSTTMFEGCTGFFFSKQNALV